MREGGREGRRGSEEGRQERAVRSKAARDSQKHKRMRICISTALSPSPSIPSSLPPLSQRTGLSQKLKVQQANVLDRDMREHHRGVAKDLAHGQDALKVQTLHHDETGGWTVAAMATRTRSRGGGAELLLRLLRLGVVCAEGQGSRRKGEGGDARTKKKEQEPEEGQASTTVHVLVLASLFGGEGERGGG